MSNGSSTATPVKRRRLLLGFGFGMGIDGSPGVANEFIAKAMRDRIDELKEDRPLVAVQWEIADAFEAVGAVPPDFVASPPLFAAAEIDLSRLKSFLRASADGSVARLVADVPALSHSDDVNTIVSALNAFLDDPSAFEHYRDLTDLADFTRPKGTIGIEKRALPHAGCTLLPGQARRVNRLVVESIVPAAAIRHGDYLSTKGVAKEVFRRATEEKKSEEIHDVEIFCCDMQFAWAALCTSEVICFGQVAVTNPLRDEAMELLRKWDQARRQGNGTVQPQDLGYGPIGDRGEHVTYGMTAYWQRPEFFDLGSAQVWVRSRDAFDAYSAM